MGEIIGVKGGIVFWEVSFCIEGKGLVRIDLFKRGWVVSIIGWRDGKKVFLFFWIFREMERFIVIRERS